MVFGNETREKPAQGCGYVLWHTPGRVCTLQKQWYQLERDTEEDKRETKSIKGHKEVPVHITMTWNIKVGREHEGWSGVGECLTFLNWSVECSTVWRMKQTWGKQVSLRKFSWCDRRSSTGLDYRDKKYEISIKVIMDQSQTYGWIINHPSTRV